MILMLIGTLMAGEPLQIDRSLEDAPIEASLTAAALEQLATGEKGRVSHALYQLETLLALPGYRAAAVTEALEAHGAVEILEGAEATAKGKALKELRLQLLEAVRARLGGDPRGAVMLDVPEVGLAERPTLAWQEVGAPLGWWRLSRSRDALLEVHVHGCERADLALFDDDLQRVGAVEHADAFVPTVLWGGDGEGYLRVRGQAGCDDDWRIAVVGRPTASELVPGERSQLSLDTAHRVRPRSDAPLPFSFAAAPGGVYRVSTEDLTGLTDTMLTMERPDGVRVSDDDGGDGLGSALTVHAFDGGVLSGHVALARRDARSTYRLTVRELHRFDMHDPIALRDGPWTLSGGAWNAQVIPVSLGDEPGVMRFRAKPGRVLGIHTDLNVSMLGPGAGAVIPLVDEDVPVAMQVGEVTTFLTLANGTYDIQVRPRDGRTHGFVQVLAARNPRPAPHRVDFGVADDPLTIHPDRERSFDGGVIASLAAGAEGWISFDVSRDDHVQLQVIGTEDDGGIEVEVWERKTSLGATAPRPFTTWEQVAEAGGTWVARIRNTGVGANDVRVAVFAEPVYSGLRVGDRVKIGRHRMRRGERNWVPSMEGFVGRNATIMSLGGTDASGAWVVALDLDAGEHVWRTRALTLVERR